MPESELTFESIQSETEDSEYSPPEFDIAVYPADFVLEVLHNKWKNNELVIPEFQRDFVWTLKQSSRLIESFMMGLPVPQIFLFTDTEQQNLVVDGQQRLKSIFYFIEGYFGNPDSAGRKKVFRLDLLNKNSKWFKRTFEDFTEGERRKFLNSVLRAIIVKQLNPKDDTSIYHIFERLNTGGTVLRDQEVRNCVYHGTFNELLIKLNKDPHWRTILGKPNPDNRQKDIELMLRGLSLAYNVNEYEKPMKEFLSKFMRHYQNPNSEFLDELENRFRKTCECIVQKLGSRPFSPKGPLNAPAFDCVFSAFYRNLDRCPDDIAEKFEALKSKNDEFKSLTSEATTDDKIVKQRHNLASKFLFGE